MAAVKATRMITEREYLASAEDHATAPPGQEMTSRIHRGLRGKVLCID
jgi:hypothetical protein